MAWFHWGWAVAAEPGISARWIGRVAIAGAIAVAFGSGLGLGILVGSGRISFSGPTPEIIYVTPVPEPSANEWVLVTDATAPASSVTLSGPGGTPSPTATPSPSASPKPAATTKPPTPQPATPTSARSDLMFYMPLSIDPARPGCGETFTVTAVIHNRGGGASKGPTIVTLVDTVGLSVQANTQAALPVMAPAQTVTLNLPLTVSTNCGENHDLTARIDPQNTIDDGGLMNNVESLTYWLAA
jgi:hypothetical protein